MAAFNSEYVLDGFDLTEENQRWLVMEGTSIPELGAPSLPSVTVPGRWGVLPLPVHGYGTSQITLKMMVTDARDGVIGKGGRQFLDINWQLLMSRLHRPGLMTLQHRAPSWVWGRQCRVRLKSISTPKISYGDGNNIVEVTVVFENVDGYWKDPGPKEMKAADLSQISGGSAPIVDARFLIVPEAGKSVKVTDNVSGTWFSWSGNLKPGEMILVEPGDYVASLLKAKSFERSGEWRMPSRQLSQHDAGFALWPNQWGQYACTAVGGDVTVQAGRAYA